MLDGGLYTGQATELAGDIAVGKTQVKWVNLKIHIQNQSLIFEGPNIRCGDIILKSPQKLGIGRKRVDRYSVGNCKGLIITKTAAI